MRNGMGTRFPFALIGLNVPEIKGIEGITIRVTSQNEGR